ncbi:DUF7261 family protein [Halorubrum trueperi]|uniref:Flagellin n=1 Tax=Halorubrum trueperi TaxID=2004704 RepID=A0ABD5UM13_9EURY
MADVSVDPPDDDRLPSVGRSSGEDRLRDADRGQLLLVAGLVMAVSLVTLVVLLNASIYSENVATRGIESADGEALEVRAAAVDGTGTLIDATNRRQFDDYTATSDGVSAGIDALDGRLAEAYAGRGGVTHLEKTDDPGLREGRYLTGPVNDTTVVSEADRTRAFSVDVAVDGLPNASESTATDEALAVALNRSEANTTHEIYVYEPDDDSSAVAVATGVNGTDAIEACRLESVDKDRLSLDLTGGEIDGEPCPAVWPAELIDPDQPYATDQPYAIEFANADGRDVEATTTVLTDSVTSDTALQVTPAVYDATIDLRYRTADLRFETTIRVAPGEPDA